MTILKITGVVILGTMSLSSLLSAHPDEYQCPHPKQLKWDPINLGKTSWNVTARHAKGWSGSYNTTASKHPKNQKISFRKADSHDTNNSEHKLLTCHYTMQGKKDLELRQIVKASQCHVPPEEPEYIQCP